MASLSSFRVMPTMSHVAERNRLGRRLDRDRQQRQPRDDDPDAASKYEPAQHRNAAPSPQRRRQPPRLSTTIAAAVTAATNAATVSPVPQGVLSSVTARA